MLNFLCHVRLLVWVRNVWKSGWNSDYSISYIIFIFFPSRTFYFSIVGFLFLLTFTFMCSQRAEVNGFVLTHGWLSLLYLVMPEKSPVCLENWFIVISMIWSIGIWLFTLPKKEAVIPFKYLFIQGSLPLKIYLST